MLDILKSEGNFVIKFVALTLKFYLCIAITRLDICKFYFTLLLIIKIDQNSK